MVLKEQGYAPISIPPPPIQTQYRSQPSSSNNNININNINNNCLYFPLPKTMKLQTLSLPILALFAIPATADTWKCHPFVDKPIVVDKAYNWSLWVWASNLCVTAWGYSWNPDPKQEYGPSCYDSKSGAEPQQFKNHYPVRLWAKGMKERTVPCHWECTEISGSKKVSG